jgi:hypothetical protein
MQPAGDGADRNAYKQVYRRNAVGVIVKKGIPALRGWPLHLAIYFATVAHLDAKLEQFAVNARRTPERISDAHRAGDPNLRRVQRDSTMARSWKTGKLERGA